jgi:DNA-directed RNA polymerase specialized sigma24 family protein
VRYVVAKLKTATIDYSAAPASYDDLFRTYYSFVVGLVGKHGISIDNREDVASEILLRFYERDFLNEFNPDLCFEVNGKIVKARFKSFLSAFVVNYVRSHRDRQNLRARREPLMVDEGVSTGFMHGGSEKAYEDDYSPLYEEELVLKIRNYLKTVPRKSRQDQCDLLSLFDTVVQQVRINGKYSVKDLQLKFGVSPTAIHTWLGWMRLNIAKALEE